MQQQPTISIPTGSSPASYTTIYDKFRGVDMSTDPALIDTTRSPDAPNLISDTGGYPEKRHGWKTVVEQPEADYTAGSPGRVNSIHRAVLSSGEVRLVHIGTKLYQWTGWDTAAETLTALTGAYADARSTSFTCAGKLWILTGSESMVRTCWPSVPVRAVRRSRKRNTTPSWRSSGPARRKRARDTA